MKYPKGKEIERKYIIDPKLRMIDIANIVNTYSICSHEIKEYYFNDTTRLRLFDDKWLITVKSIDTLVRDEFEFEVNHDLDFTPMPLMVKTRYIIPYEGHELELNVFSNIYDDNNRNMLILEVELQSENEEVVLPSWVFKDVTTQPMFYGFNLFKRLKQETQQQLKN